MFKSWILFISLVLDSFSRHRSYVMFRNKYGVYRPSESWSRTLEDHLGSAPVQINGSDSLFNQTNSNWLLMSCSEFPLVTCELNLRFFRFTAANKTWGQRLEIFLSWYLNGFSRCVTDACCLNLVRRSFSCSWFRLHELMDVFLDSVRENLNWSLFPCLPLCWMFLSLQAASVNEHGSILLWVVPPALRVVFSSPPELIWGLLTAGWCPGNGDINFSWALRASEAEQKGCFKAQIDGGSQRSF